ncbi:hypothetical protein M378DRAFT_167081 [Amanita muscaria Koide BX008]|uniref:Uncharacterized protein n=1 Tax=Amanita muscaria (strain Koide BX008) TaxID=946122 RepID=A0A0C2WY03_AMAMK|nr:hypothetical protein M378DRAFT_167081 [Amanita muscaria Koide BX008]
MIPETEDSGPLGEAICHGSYLDTLRCRNVTIALNHSALQSALAPSPPVCVVPDGAYNLVDKI